MRLHERAPRHRALPAGWNALGAQDPRDRRPADVVAQVLSRALQARVAPRRVLGRHRNDEHSEACLRVRRTASAGAIRPRARHQLAVPPQNGVGRHDSRELREQRSRDGGPTRRGVGARRRRNAGAPRDRTGSFHRWDTTPLTRPSSFALMGEAHDHGMVVWSPRPAIESCRGLRGRSESRAGRPVLHDGDRRCRVAVFVDEREDALKIGRRVEARYAVRQVADHARRSGVELVTH